MAKPNPIQMQKYLKGLNYPAQREQIVAHARQNGADGTVVKLLEKLPEQSYKTPADVSKQVGKLE